MTSVKVSERTPVFMSRLNTSKLGGVVSGIKLLTGKLSGASVYWLLLISDTALDESLRYVSLGDEANISSNFSRFKSSSVSSTTRITESFCCTLELCKV